MTPEDRARLTAYGYTDQLMDLADRLRKEGRLATLFEYDKESMRAWGHS